MLFLVDGYNVTRSDPDTKHLSLQAQREALIARLRTRGTHLLGAGRIVVTFDAAEGHVGSTSDSSPVRVVYARDGTADDAIVRAVKGVAEKVVVITNDRELVERVRVHALGEVEQRPASACYESTKPAARKRGRGGVARDVGLPSGANRITEELKELWLDDE